MAGTLLQALLADVVLSTYVSQLADKELPRRTWKYSGNLALAPVIHKGTTAVTRGLKQ